MENGAVYKLPTQSGYTIFGENIEALEELKKILCLHKPTLLEESRRVEKGGEKIIIKTQEGEKEKTIKELPTVFNFKTREGEMACVIVEGGKYGVLSIFPETTLSLDNIQISETNLDINKLEGVKKAWPDFRSNTTADEIYGHIQKVIKTNNLGNKLFVLPIHPNGAIDIVRRDKTGRPIDKSLLPAIIKEMYGEVPIVMFGDGLNDISAFREGVYAVTFSNAGKEVQQCVEEKGVFGFISPSGAPEGLGVAEGIYFWAKEKIFQEDSEKIIEIIRELEPEIIENVEPLWQERLERIERFREIDRTRR